jgi:hypothetical protein
VDSWETETKMLTHVADARAAGDATVVAGAQDDVKGVATAEVAVRYVRHLIDRHRGPVIVDSPPDP